MRRHGQTDIRPSSGVYLCMFLEQIIIHHQDIRSVTNLRCYIDQHCYQRHRRPHCPFDQSTEETPLTNLWSSLNKPQYIQRTIMTWTGRVHPFPWVWQVVVPPARSTAKSGQGEECVCNQLLRVWPRRRSARQVRLQPSLVRVRSAPPTNPCGCDPDDIPPARLGKKIARR